MGTLLFFWFCFGEKMWITVSGFFLAGKNFFRGRQSKDLGEDRLNEVQKYLTCIRIISDKIQKGNL